MRRVSYIGPLLLILIGGLFLVHNMYPDLPLADWFAQFWPFLLIGWGVLRLIEILTWAFMKRPLPANGITGGEWALVVLLFVIGSGVSAVHARGWWAGPNFHLGDFEMFGEAFDYPVSGEVANAGKSPKIIIESFRGNARIVGADATDVKVTGRKTVRALKQADADQANSQTPFEVVKNGSEVVIRTNQDRLSEHQRISADLDPRSKREAATATSKSATSWVTWTSPATTPASVSRTSEATSVSTPARATLSAP